MSGKDTSGEFAAWFGPNSGAAAHLVPANPPKSLEVNGAPVVEQSHEYVLKKKPRPNA